MPPTKIAYYVHGRGRGHSSRALSIVPALRARGAQVTLYGSDDALQPLRTLGPVRERTRVRPGAKGLLTLGQRAYAERSELRLNRPQLVISDGDQPALIAARAAGIASIAIGHDLVFLCCQLPAGLPKGHLAHQRINGWIPRRLSSRRIAVHFLPIQSLDRDCRVARPETSGQPDKPHPRLRRIVAYFRDQQHARAAPLLRALCPDTHVFGASGKPPVAQQDFRLLVAESRAVVASAGSNLLAECVLTGTPLLALYRADDPEQALNAQLLSMSGAGMACDVARLDARLLEEFWARAGSGDFSTVDLQSEVPSVVEATLQSCRDLTNMGSP